MIVRDGAPFDPSGAMTTRGLTCSMVAAAVLAMCAAGCGRSDARQDHEPAPIAAPPPEPGQQPKNEVVRHAGMEAEDGRASIRQTVIARKAADATSPVVATLYSGTVVTRVGRFGDFHLVAWTSLAGPQQGWVDGALAFQVRGFDVSEVRPRSRDVQAVSDAGP